MPLAAITPALPPERSRAPPTHRLDAAERLARGAEVQLGLDIEQALAETARCFSCGTCIHCDNCVIYCPDLAVQRVGGGYRVLADYCKGCGLCVKECPTGSMTMLEECDEPTLTTRSGSRRRTTAKPRADAADRQPRGGLGARGWRGRRWCRSIRSRRRRRCWRQLTEFQAEGEFDAEIITPESEHSVMSACIPASLAGVRVFTATASQGLLLMHELLHYASGARAPIVMANVNRTVASPWAFWPDQTDSLAQRDTGWIQFYVESAQEALDTVIQAFRVAEQVLLPAMVNLDAFYVSHALEPVERAGAGDWSMPTCRRSRPSSGSTRRSRRVLGQRRHAGHVLPPPPGRSRRRWTACPRWPPRPTANGPSAPGAAGAWSSATAATAPARVIVTHGQHVRHRARRGRRAARRRPGRRAASRCGCSGRCRSAALRAALAGRAPTWSCSTATTRPAHGGVLHQELRAALYGMPDAPRIHG